MQEETLYKVPTAASPEELSQDIWDDDNCCSYSSDGTRLLDAENFPGTVTVKDGCRVICDGVFAFQDYMADVRLGEEIPLEERNSFLEKIKLPDTITHIGNGAFSECGCLERIRLPKSLLWIGDDAFSDCWQLERITVPAGCRHIGDRAFQGCINMYEIKLGKGVEFIGEDAFDDCEGLESILVPSGTAVKFMRMIPRGLHSLIEEL